MAKKQTAPPASFEEAVKELEAILGEMERGEIGLEESLAKYERGNLLVQYCQTILSSAEKQIEVISRGPRGQVEVKKVDDLPA